jgi:hypothetical protein
MSNITKSLFLIQDFQFFTRKSRRETKHDCVNGVKNYFNQNHRLHIHHQRRLYQTYLNRKHIIEG